MGSANRGVGVQPGPVEEAVEGFLVFPAQGPPEFLPRLALPLPNFVEWQNGAVHGLSPKKITGA
jgi:hypothetical protein